MPNLVCFNIALSDKRETAKLLNFFNQHKLLQPSQPSPYLPNAHAFTRSYFKTKDHFSYKNYHGLAQT